MRCAAVSERARCLGRAPEREVRPVGTFVGWWGSRSSRAAHRSGPLAWFVATRDNVKHSFALAGRASAAALVANMLGDVPPGVRAQAGRETRAHLADLMYGGDAERMDADMRFHRDGFTLLARDLTKDGHLLFRSEADLTSRQLAVRRRIQGDSRALLPFLLLVMNTFPLTMAILEPLLQRGLPRHWVLPSCFEDSRLRLIERARKLSTRNAAR